MPCSQGQTLIIADCLAQGWRAQFNRLWKQVALRYSLPMPSPPPTVLLTGFDAFGTERVNPSGLAAQALHGQVLLGHRVVGAVLPTVFSSSLAALEALVHAHQPTLVVCVGLAGGRTGLSLERVALNLDDARIPDNAGVQPVDTPVVPDGPAAYFSSLPVKAMHAVLHQHGFEVAVSNSAGTFVCNHVFYGLMHALAGQRGALHCRGGFIHVPHLQSDAHPAGWPLARLVDALRLAVQCALSTPTDLQLGAGDLP